MELVMNNFSNINFLSVLVATIASFMFGWLWYSPVLFGKPWMKILGFTEEQLKNAGGMGKLMAMAFVVNFIMATAIAYLVVFFPVPQTALVLGLFIGLLLHGTATGTSYLFERKPFKLWAINVTHDTITYIIMGLLAAYWNNVEGGAFGMY